MGRGTSFLSGSRPTRSVPSRTEKVAGTVCMGAAPVPDKDRPSKYGRPIKSVDIRYSTGTAWSSQPFGKASVTLPGGARGLHGRAPTGFTSVQRRLHMVGLSLSALSSEHSHHKVTCVHTYDIISIININR